MSLYKRVATYGSFDLFHTGHLTLLRRASTLGPLMVFISTDEFHKEKKGHPPIIPWNQRAEIIQGTKGVSAVFAEGDMEQKKRDIVNYGIDCLVMGGDWEGKFDELRELCDVVYLNRTRGVSTTDIIRRAHEISIVEGIKIND